MGVSSADMLAVVVVIVIESRVPSLRMHIYGLANDKIAIERRERVAVWISDFTELLIFPFI